MNEEEEPGICSCCRAAGARRSLNNTGMMPVCEECYADGTFRKWLVDELEKYSKDSGMISRVDEKGRTLWSKP